MTRVQTAATSARIKAYRVKGTTSDVTTCAQCGREDLKRTIVLAVLDADGNEVEVTYMGSDCGARAAGWTQAKVNKDARAADTAAREAEERQRNLEWAARRAEFESRFQPWLEKTYGTRDVKRAVLIHFERTGTKTTIFRLQNAFEGR